jgi:hypothetical protein
MLPARQARAARRATGRQRVGARLASRAEELRPRTFGQLLDCAAEIFASNFVLCIALAGGLWLPVKLMEEVLWRSPEGEALMLPFGMLMGTLTVALQFQCAGFLAPTVVGWHRGERVGARASLRQWIGRLPGLLVLSGLLFVLSIAGTCLCIVPGWLVQWIFFVIPAVYVVERVDVPTAIGRSVNLAKGWGGLGRWVGLSIVSAIMLLPFSTTTPLSIGSPVFRDTLQEALALRSGPVDLLAVLLVVLFMAVASGFQAVLIGVYYVDQRVRKEGYDLELALEERRGAERVTRA